MTPFDFQPTTRVIFGAGTMARLGELARELGGARALVVSDPGIAGAGHLDRGVQLLHEAGLVVATFTGVQENPTTAHVDAALEVAKANRIDLLVGLGGGSSVDTAKGVNFLLTNGGVMADYWGVGKARRPMLPMIAVPTTAGTGSEAQSFALIADAATHRKMACGDKKAACRAAILDPEVTLSQPSRVAAVSCIDALSHALETWVTSKRTAVSRAFSRAAWELLTVGIPRMFEDGADVEARGRILLGAHFAGAAIENSMLGAAHAAANPLTARFAVTHGAAVGLMLPHVVEHNGDCCADDYAELAAALAPNAVPAHAAASATLADYVRKMLRRAKLAERLSDYGIARTDIASLAQDAAREWTGKYNPVTVAEADFVRLYEAAL